MQEPALAGRRGGLGPLDALGLLIGLGILLRMLFFLAWRPGFLGYPDAAVYLEAAHGKFGNSRIPNTVFFDRMRPAGYPMFLRLVHGIDSHLVFAIAVQHALGIAAAIVLYALVRRAGASGWFALVPAAVVLLGGMEVFLEHSPLTEALYIVLQAGALYAAVRAAESGDPGWAALAGGLIGAAADVRFLGLTLVPVIVVWIFAARKGPWTGRLLHAGTALLASVLLVGGYVYAQRQATGFTGLTEAGQWNLYGRVAPFADCSRFKPPAGTSVLCESTRPSQRPGPLDYVFGQSPATTAFGYPDWSNSSRIASREDDRKIAAFAHAVILHQPFDFAHTVAREMVRYVHPKLVSTKHGNGLLPGQMIAELTNRDQTNLWIGYAGRPYFRSSDVHEHGSLLSALKTYERWTRFSGVLFLLALALAFAGPFVGERRARSVGALLAASAVVLMVGPPATIFWDARIVLPVYGVLAAAAAIGLSSVLPVIEKRRAARRG